MDSPKRTPDTPRPQPSTHLKQPEIPPKRYELRMLEEAPLIRQRVLLSEPTMVFPDRVSMLKQEGGKLDSQVPAIHYVIAEEGRVGGYRLANSKGEAVGWVRLNESQTGHEWSIGTVWSPKENCTELNFYNDLEGTVGTPMPKEILDVDYLYPILENNEESWRMLLGRPFPRSIKTEMEFPVWASYRVHGFGKISYLVEKDQLDHHTRNFEFLSEAWERRKPADLQQRRPFSATKVTRADVQLFKATKLAIADLCLFETKQASDLDMEKSTTYLRKFGLVDSFSYLYADIIDVSFDDRAPFPILLDLKRILQALHQAKTAESYSIFQNGTPQKFVNIRLH